MTDFEFETQRETNDINFNPDIARLKVYSQKVEHGYILNWTQLFADLGGFDALFNVLSMGMDDEKAAKAPFKLISYLMKPYKTLNLTFSPEFAAIFTSKISDVTVKRLQGMSEKEVKHCSKDSVEQLFTDLNQVLHVGMD